MLARANKGTGLGLPLTKDLVELHGGIFDLESDPGNGTIVRITIPEERVKRTNYVSLIAV